MTALTYEDAGLLADRARPGILVADAEIEVWEDSCLVGFIGEFSGLSTRFVRGLADGGQATFTISVEDPLLPVLRECKTRYVGLRIRDGVRPWDGQVTRVNLAADDDDESVTVEAKASTSIFQNILTMSDALAPEWLQVSKKRFWSGPVISGLTREIRDQAARLALYVRPAPRILVPQVDTWHDTSPRRTWRTDPITISELVEKVTEDTGVTVEVITWRPGDPLTGLPVPVSWIDQSTTQFIVRPVQHERSGAMAAAHNRLETLAIEMAQFLTDALAWIGQGSARWIGKRWTEALTGTGLPVVSWQYGGAGVVSEDTDDTAPEAVSALVGGASPNWLNDLTGSLAQAAVAILSAEAGVIIPGLGGIAEDLLSDRLFTYTRVHDTQVHNTIGGLAPPEVFVNSATGLSLEAETTGRAQLEEIAGRVATTVTVADGMPWRAFDDFDMGDTVAYTDRTNREVIGVVTAIEIHRDRATGRAATVTIGRPPDIAVGSRAKRSGAAALTIANQLSLS
ncbi:MAG: hypothetical protein L0K27_01645 [Corynebacterium nuruki]|nr:hypothetical protein [Corynebacterium nuruki]